MSQTIISGLRNSGSTGRVMSGMGSSGMGGKSPVSARYRKNKPLIPLRKSGLHGLIGQTAKNK